MQVAPLRRVGRTPSGDAACLVESTRLHRRRTPLRPCANPFRSRRMRNRWYDPSTGRFTQEDPIGDAGGINLYAYAGNDPVTFSDPYGLKVCLAGNSDQVNTLKDSLSSVTNSDITYDDNNCVTGFTARKGDGYGEIQSRFGAAVNSRSTYEVRILAEGGTEKTDCAGIAGCLIGVKDGTPLPHARPLVGCAWPQQQRTGLRASIAHELIGHGANHAFGYRSGTAFNEGRALHAENLFNSASQHSARCP